MTEPALHSESILKADATPIDAELLQRIVEGALLAASKPLTVDDLGALFEAQEKPTNDAIRAALAAIAGQSSGRGFQLREVASGFRFQVIQDVAPWIARLWDEKPQKYSRALLETLALIAYRQPITRGDIEDIRGVAVASNIVKTLLERDWIRVVGHKDVPGRPAMYATTRRFLDYFNLHNLDDLPTLAEIRDLDSMNTELALEGIDTVMVADDAPADEVAISAAEISDGEEAIATEPSRIFDAVDTDNAVDVEATDADPVDDSVASAIEANTDFPLMDEATHPQESADDSSADRDSSSSPSTPAKSDL